MLGHVSISEISMSSYLDLLLSGEAYEFVMHVSRLSTHNVYITSEAMFGNVEVFKNANFYLYAGYISYD